jgi:hypothetical protein
MPALAVVEVLMMTGGVLNKGCSIARYRGGSCPIRDTISATECRPVKMLLTYDYLVTILNERRMRSKDMIVLVSKPNILPKNSDQGKSDRKHVV